MQLLVHSLKLIGTTPAETNFHHIFQLAADCKFQELRAFVAKEIGLEILVDQSGWIKSYDFFASEGYFIEYLRTKDLCNERGTSQTLDVTNVIILSIQSLPLAL